jgi:TatD DNase family protein
LFFDTHAHYDDARYDGDRDAVLSGLKSKGVAYVVNAGSDADSSKAGLALSERYDYIWFAAGIHPHCAADAPDDFETALAELSGHEKAVAIGEIGLDYHYDFSPRERQKEVFSRQLALAGKMGAPVIIHNREADDDIVGILKAHAGEFAGGVFHCFSGDRALAKKALDLGFHIAFGGAITFKNSGRLAEAAAYVPMDRLLIETDCPYMTPEPHRGRRNDSSKISIVAERLAMIKGVSAESVADLTAVNAKKLFSID